MHTRRIPCLCAVLLASIPSSTSFYLPGSAPRDFERGDQIPVLVNALSPTLEGGRGSGTILSYDYYSPEFGFCQPKPGPPKKQPEGLGSILSGDRLYDSPYDLRMQENSTCKILCTTTINAENAKVVNQRIRERLAVNWLVDGLPAAQPMYLELESKQQQRPDFLEPGIMLGFDGIQFESATPEVSRDVFALYNHYDIYVEFHQRTPTLSRVISVSVYPSSRNNIDGTQCDSKEPLELSEERDNRFAYTYSVHWKPSSTRWATRWDNYLHIMNPSIHWLSLFNSVAVVGFLVAMVALILWRSVAKDLRAYQSLDLMQEGIQEDYGWRLVHGEVFRRPRHRMLLSVCVGTGSQLIVMSAATLLFALLGFVSPSSRGSLSAIILGLYMVTGGIAGYVSSIAYASFEGQDWKKNALATAVGFPGALFAILNLLNFFLVSSGASGALPAGTLLSIVLIWLCVSVPLSFAGSFFGIRKGALPSPVPVQSIPRQIPTTPIYLRFWPATVLGGIFAFVAGFVELSSILNNLFGNRYYTAFGFLVLCSVIITLTTSTVTILLIYFKLCAEDYRWHWQSFFIGGGSSIWLFLYGLIYWSTRLSLNGISSRVLYIGYLTCLASVNFLITGTIGFISTTFFLRRIYRDLRID